MSEDEEKDGLSSSNFDSWSSKSSNVVEDCCFEVSKGGSKVLGAGKLRWWCNSILDGSIDLKSFKISFVQTRSGNSL